MPKEHLPPSTEPKDHDPFLPNLSEEQINRVLLTYWEAPTYHDALEKMGGSQNILSRHLRAARIRVGADTMEQACLHAIENGVIAIPPKDENTMSLLLTKIRYDVISDLVVEGLSNAQIAERHGLSPRQVFVMINDATRVARIPQGDHHRFKLFRWIHQNSYGISSGKTSYLENSPYPNATESSDIRPPRKIGEPSLKDAELVAATMMHTREELANELGYDFQSLRQRIKMARRRLKAAPIETSEIDKLALTELLSEGFALTEIANRLSAEPLVVARATVDFDISRRSMSSILSPPPEKPPLATKKRLFTSGSQGKEKKKADNKTVTLSTVTPIKNRILATKPDAARILHEAAELAYEEYLTDDEQVLLHRIRAELEGYGVHEACARVVNIYGYSAFAPLRLVRRLEGIRNSNTNS